MKPGEIKLVITDSRSIRNLKGVHPDLIRVVCKAAEYSEVPFIVLEGLRTPERQKELLAAGASRTLNSRHLTGHAVDLACTVGGKVRWDWPLYRKLAACMKKASKELGIPIEWGGDWRDIQDGPHFQLPWRQYRANT